MPVFALYLYFPLTNYTSVLTFSTAFDRSLHQIMLRCQPVVMSTKDYVV